MTTENLCKCGDDITKHLPSKEKGIGMCLKCPCEKFEPVEEIKEEVTWLMCKKHMMPMYVKISDNILERQAYCKKCQKLKITLCQKHYNKVYNSETSVDRTLTPNGQLTSAEAEKDSFEENCDKEYLKIAESIWYCPRCKGDD